MNVDEATRFKLQQEATAHCMEVWPCIEEYRFARDLTVLARANSYLGQLADTDKLMYEIVMKMLSLRSGVDWASIRDSLT